MILFRKSLCPGYPNEPLAGKHRFAFKGDFPDDIGGKCSGCGVAARDLDTIWDKIQWAYYGVVPYHLRPKNLWYTFSCWAWKRYTTTKPRTLDHGWCDRNALIEHTIIEIARQFLEKEGPETEEEWAWQAKHNPEFYAAWRETKEIIDWWLARGDEYPWDMPDEEFDKLHPWTMPPNYDGTEYSQRCFQRLLVEDKNKVEVREKLKRIVELTPWYWT